MANARRLLIGVLGLLALALLLPAAEAAAPKLKAKAEVARAGDGVRLMVTVTSSKKLTARTKPRAVQVTAEGVSLNLVRGKAKRKSVVWRSTVYRGEQAAAVEGLRGRRLDIRIRTRAGTVKRKATLPAQTTPDSTGGGGSTGGGSTGGGPQITQPSDPKPPPDVPVRDDARFADVMGRSYFQRVYYVQNGNQTNTHDEDYKFCGARLFHHYTGIAYIYDSDGPWKVLEGSISPDGSKGFGFVEFLQENANFDEEKGKVQRIEFRWEGTKAVINHPEIGSYNFERAVGAHTC